MKILNSKIKKENGRGTTSAPPVILRQSYSYRRECYEQEKSDHDSVVHRVVRGTDHYCLVFGSPVAHHFHIAVERALVLEPEEQACDDKYDSDRERNTNQAMDKTELDRLLGDGAPFIVPLAEDPLLKSRQEWENERQGEEEHGNHQTNQDVAGIRSLCDRLDEHVAALTAEEEIDPAIVEAGNLPQSDCCCNRQRDNSQTFEENLDSEPLPHRPDELIITAFGNEQQYDAGDCEQDKKNLANRKQNFHRKTSFSKCRFLRFPHNHNKDYQL
jgi:hypothetical protein